MQDLIQIYSILTGFDLFIRQKSIFDLTIKINNKMNELEKEYNELQNMYNYFTINSIFGSVTTYAKIRSYTTKKQLYQEVKNLHN